MSQMIVLFILILSCLSVSAQVIPNINGVEGRLENISCHGAWVANKARLESRTYPEIERVCRNDDDACIEQMIKKSSVTNINAHFNGLALIGQKKFSMTIVDTASNKLLFRSIRTGFHGDTVKGINLMFQRDGVVNDEFLISINDLVNEGKTAPMMMVPVNRSFVADQVYFFFNCDLVWLY